MNLVKLTSACALLMIAGANANDKAMKIESQVLIDFSKKPDGFQIGVTNDGVMGGLSQGKVKITDQGILLFTGKLSLENNGGFSSLRMRGKQWDLGAWKGLELKVKGDGRRYGFRATTDQQFRMSQVSFTANFATKKNEWTTVRLPFSAMTASWRGRKLDNLFDAEKISGLGIILADKNEGAFGIEVKSISVWR